MPVSIRLRHQQIVNRSNFKLLQFQKIGQGAHRLCQTLARQDKRPIEHLPGAVQFAGRQASVPEIARTLGAQVLLEASVSVEGPTVIVEARLVKAATDRKFWVERFTADAGEIRTLQQRIASTVSAAAVRGTPHFPQ